MYTAVMDTHELVKALLRAATKTTNRLDGSLASIKGISFSEYQLLSALEQRPGMVSTRVDLAAEVGLTPSGVTRALKPLEKLGFVNTVKDVRDARRSLATLTAAGIELVQDAAGVVADTVAEIDGITALSDQDRDALGQLLGSMARS